MKKAKVELAQMYLGTKRPGPKLQWSEEIREKIQKIYKYAKAPKEAQLEKPKNSKPAHVKNWNGLGWFQPRRFDFISIFPRRNAT